MIEPKDGELDYDLYYKNPVKFYDHLLTQDITEHRVINRAKVETKVTKRQVSILLSELMGDKLSTLLSELVPCER